MKGGWSTADFVTNYLPFITFPVLYVGARFWRQSHFIDPKDMDFKSGLAEVEAASYDEPPPRNWVERFWGWLVSTFILRERYKILTLYGCYSDVIATRWSTQFAVQSIYPFLVVNQFCNAFVYRCIDDNIFLSEYLV